VVESGFILALCTVWEGATRQRRSVVRARRLTCDCLDHMRLVSNVRHVKSGWSSLHFSITSSYLDVRRSYGYRALPKLQVWPMAMDVRARVDARVDVVPRAMRLLYRAARARPRWSVISAAVDRHHRTR
jgi:hypothetical protein